MVKSKDEPSPEALLQALNQLWLHIRHMENGRLQFTYVYAILVAAILTLLYKYDLENYPFPYLVFTFLVLLSILGLIWVQKVDIEISNHIIKIERTALRLHLEDHTSLPVGYGKLISITLVFRVFYYFMIFLWSLILTYSIIDVFHTAFLVSLVVLGLTYLIVRIAGSAVLTQVVTTEKMKCSKKINTPIEKKDQVNPKWLLSICIIAILVSIIACTCLGSKSELKVSEPKFEVSERQEMQVIELMKIHSDFSHNLSEGILLNRQAFFLVTTGLLTYYFAKKKIGLYLLIFILIFITIVCYLNEGILCYWQVQHLTNVRLLEAGLENKMKLCPESEYRLHHVFTSKPLQNSESRNWLNILVFIFSLNLSPANELFYFGIFIAVISLLAIAEFFDLRNPNKKREQKVK